MVNINEYTTSNENAFKKDRYLSLDSETIDILPFLLYCNSKSIFMRRNRMIGLLFQHFYIAGMGSMVVSGAGIAFLFSIIGLVGMAERVLIGLAAYNDACSKGNPDAVMWGLLIGFLGLIPGIIYLCVRNSGRQYTMCSNCGLRHFAMDPNCPRCGAPNVVPPYANPYVFQQAHRAKVLLIVAIFLIAFVVIAGVICAVSLIASIASVSGGTFY